MLSTDERNALVVSKKADIINKKHRGYIRIKTDPAEYQGSIVTIPGLRNCAAFSFSRNVIDDTPGQAVRVVATERFGGATKGYSDLDDALQGKAMKVPARQTEKQDADPNDQFKAKVAKKIDKILDDSDEQALDEFFASLLD